MAFSFSKCLSRSLIKALILDSLESSLWLHSEIHRTHSLTRVSFKSRFDSKNMEDTKG